jgi:hypothetical protein
MRDAKRIAQFLSAISNVVGPLELNVLDLICGKSGGFSLS